MALADFYKFAATQDPPWKEPLTRSVIYHLRKRGDLMKIDGRYYAKEHASKSEGADLSVGP